MNKTILLIATTMLIATGAFCAGLYLANYRAEVEALRKRVRETELTMWQWRGELDALQQIGVDVRVIDTSTHANVMRVTMEEQSKLPDMLEK